MGSRRPGHLNHLGLAAVLATLVIASPARGAVPVTPEGMSLGAQPVAVASAELSGFAPTAGPVVVATTPPTMTFVGASSTDNQANATSEPPDGAIAAGPQHLVEAVNSSIAVFTKTGTRLSETPLATFFELPSVEFPTDPRAHYDLQTGRWLVLALSASRDLTISHLHVAFSQTGDPLGTYCKLSFDMTLVDGTRQPILADFPGLGVNADGFYVTMTRVWIDRPAIFDARILQLRRSMFDGCIPTAAAAGWSVSGNFPDGSPVEVLQPTLTYGSSAEYFVASQVRGGSYIAIYSLPVGGSQITGPTFLHVAFYPGQATAIQQGSPIRLDVGDARVPAAAVWRNGSLWFAHGAGSPESTPGVVWYQVDPTNGLVTARQLLWFSGGGYFQPSIMVDSAGNVVLNMGVAGPAIFPGTAFATRRASDPAGELGNVITYSVGFAPHDFTTTRSFARWGDYHGVALDPDGQHLWLEGESALTDNNWRTVIAQVSAGAAGEIGRYAVTTSPPSPIAGSSVSVTARLTDATGTPLAVSGRIVTWSAVPAGGSFATPTSTTDATGTATVSYRTSAVVGSFTVSAADDLGAIGTAPSFLTRQRPSPTTTLYLPNVTKTLGGPGGFQTPFIIQNVGTVPTDLELTFYRFTDGAVVTQRSVSSLAPGASFADIPNNDPDLPDNTQFSVVVRSFGSQVVSVVNEHGGTIEADAYAAIATGATTVYLPNIVRRFFGFHSPIICQNLGTASATITATFVSFDGSAPQATVTRTIGPGQSQFIEPNSEPTLVDGKQYAVTIKSDQPIGVVVNTHNDDPGVAHPVFYSANGLSAGAAAVYGAYAVRNANGGRISTIVVENVGPAPVTPTLTFTPFAGPTTQTFTAPGPVSPGGSWAFDPRFTNGVASSDSTKLCASSSSTCLGDGEYSFVARASGPVGAMVNVIGPDSAMGYTASTSPANNYFLPNVLANYFGWTTPIYVQSVAATSAILTWTPFSGGTPITQTVALVPGRAVRVDPEASAPVGAQYAVKITATGAVAAIVMELNSAGGDNAMIYAGFPTP
ncbi:MAG TPA: Ig-like domain-containing protein [Candidatus Limnocylindria bacterium]